MKDVSASRKRMATWQSATASGVSKADLLSSKWSIKSMKATRTHADSSWSPTATASATERDAASWMSA
eukprot:CAMPEP_0204555162 /NCGR_PEP_ID=MMETSP0661-20131031/28636_1 /ASSEMBLY_ACC=CAM_ASM_000606 /TAXON_ID=109239 /ORGANISM="Alexandrium margalefi, Strain AMGDE01CS-322" /LENGTH=67 /DNA_ID=CAMNT_0051562249 /DNA_START=30 /DNA_END=229 /DNA_ORIENTATION=+